MNRTIRIIGYSTVLAIGIFLKQFNYPSLESGDSSPKEKVAKTKPKLPTSDNESALKFSINPKSNGDSPYDRYFGKGIYHETQNSVLIKASSNSDVVFILIDIYTGKKIRNEYIRKGTSFEMTKIPYGTYDYMYYSGNDWSDNYPVNGSIIGGFMKNSSFTKNSYTSDRLEFKRGYYGSYEITLYEVANGNLETTSTNSSDFFN